MVEGRIAGSSSSQSPATSSVAKLLGLAWRADRSVGVGVSRLSSFAREPPHYKAFCRKCWGVWWESFRRDEHFTAMNHLNRVLVALATFLQSILYLIDAREPF